MTQMRLKLFMNINKYVDDRAKLIYVISCLKENVMNQISSYIVTDKIINFENVKIIFFKLKLIFDDLNKKVIVQNKLRNLRLEWPLGRDWDNFFDPTQPIGTQSQ